MALEECYPLEWWNHADQQGWLEDREPSSILPEATTKRLVNGETSFEQLADGLDGKLMIAKLGVSGSKVAWARWVAKKQQNDLTGNLNHLTDLIREGLAYVGDEIAP